MGLIRGTLMLGTGGLVHGSSKKQRVAKSQLRELQAQTKLLEQIADPGKLEREHAARQEVRERRVARIEAASEARHQRALARKERLATRRGNTQQRVTSRAPKPAWATRILRVVGWAWVVFLVLVAISVASVNIMAALTAGVLAAGLTWALVRRSSPRTAATAPASQEPTL